MIFLQPIRDLKDLDGEDDRHPTSHMKDGTAYVYHSDWLYNRSNAMHYITSKGEIKCNGMKLRHRRMGTILKNPGAAKSF